MNKKNSYIGITFIILLFGIYTVPKIAERFGNKEPLSYIASITSEDEYRKVPNFEFVNQEGQKITNKTYAGKVYVVEFFFSTCPSICPIMNRKMLSIQDAFFGNSNFGKTSISITPDIDTPEVLKAYSKDQGITHRNWHLLTGASEEAVYALSNNGFSLYAGKSSGEHGGFEHSGLFALVDKEGYLRSRKDEFGNPIMFYRALEEHRFPDQISELKEDIKLGLNE